MSTSTELTDPDLSVLDASAGALQSVGPIVGLTRTLLQKTPSQFVSSHGLAQLLGGFQNTYNELTAYQSDKNVAHIQNAKANIEQGVMPFLWAFASLPPEDNAGQVVDLVNQVSRSAAEAIEQVLSRRNQYAEKIDEFSRQIQTVQAQIEAHAQIIAQQKAEVGAAVAVIHKENTEREIQQVTSFEALLKKFKESFDSTHENAHVAQEEILLALRNNQTDAARIVQVVGNIGTTGNYQKIANLEGSQANLWRRVTIFFFLLGITLAAATW